MDVAKYILSPKNLLLHLSLTYLGRLDQNKEQADAAGKTFSDPLGKLATVKQLFVYHFCFHSSIYLSAVCLFVYLSICLFVCLSVYLSIY